jgi:hypothetical protein
MTKHWKSNGQDGKNLLEIFKSSSTDLNNTSAKYISAIKEKYPQFFGEFSKEVFIRHYRTLLAAYKAGEALKGARKKGKDVFDMTIFLSNILLLIIFTKNQFRQKRRIWTQFRKPTTTK